MSTQDPRIEAEAKPSLFVKLTTEAEMFLRRAEVEQLLRANGWKTARQGARFFQWNRRDSEPLWTPVGKPSLDVAEEWASLLDQAAAIAVKPIDPVPSPAADSRPPPKILAELLAAGIPVPPEWTAPPTPEVTDAVAAVPSPAPKESGGVGATSDGLLRALFDPSVPTPPLSEVLAAALSATPAIEPSGAADVLAHPLESRRDALVARLLAAGFVEAKPIIEVIPRFTGYDLNVLIPVGHPCEVEFEFGAMLDKADEQVGKVEAAKRDRQGVAVEPLSGRWGQQHSAPLPDGLAGLGARGQEPLAPGPTLAEVQAENQQLRTLHSEAVAAREAAKRQRDEALAAAERERVQANEWLSQLHDANERIAALKASNTGIAQELADVNWTLNALGASGTGPAKERLMQVLPLPRVVALLEVEAAEADTVVKRIRCRNPDMTSGEEPLSTAMDREQEACERLRVARDRLDHLPEGGKMVEAE